MKKPFVVILVLTLVFSLLSAPAYAMSFDFYQLHKKIITTRTPRVFSPKVVWKEPTATEPSTTPVVPTETVTTPVVPTETVTTPVVPTETVTTPVVPTETVTTPVVPAIVLPIEVQLGALGFDVTALGANGDDMEDDTAAIQSALDRYDSVYIPAGTYMIDVTKSLRLRSNQTLTLDDSAILQAIPTTQGSSSVLKINDVSDVVVSGGQIIGERYSHKGTSGEWGMGITIESGASNVTISNMTISDCWGDGVYLGGTNPVNNITVDNVISSNNRRQGMSITNATQVTVSNSVFKDTNGTAPAAGIDIEPNAGKITEDITIINTQCYGNEGAGLSLMGYSETIQRITVDGCTFENNDSSGIDIVNAKDLTFRNTSVMNNYTGIEIPRDVANVQFTNMTISNNQYRGVSIVGTSQKTGIENITFENCKIADNSQSKIGGVDGVRIDNYDLTGYVKDITFTNCSFIDDQTVKTQRYGITVGFSDDISNIVIAKDNIFSGNIVGGFYGSNINS